VGGVGEESLLDGAGLAHPSKQLVESLDGGSDLRRGAGLRKRPKIVWTAPEQLAADSRQRSDAVLDACPGESHGGERDQKRRDQPCGQNFPDQAMPLRKRFANLHAESAVGPQRCDANRFATIDAVEEPAFPIAQRRRWRELVGAGNNCAVSAANLEDHRIDVIEHQRFLRLHQQVEVRAVVADADVLGHVQSGVEQRAIVR
jgi:hypothetical protein